MVYYVLSPSSAKNVIWCLMETRVIVITERTVPITDVHNAAGLLGPGITLIDTYQRLITKKSAVRDVKQNLMESIVTTIILRDVSSDVIDVNIFIKLSLRWKFIREHTLQKTERQKNSQRGLL